MSWKGSRVGSTMLNTSSSETSLSETFSESSESSLSGSWSPPSPSLGNLNSLKHNKATGSTDSVATITLSNSNLSVSKPPLLRKKSGDVVKSSLKLPALVRCKSTSNVLLKKSVSFASRLENVKMFDGTDSPSAVSTNDNSPLESPKNGRSRLRTSYFSWDWDSVPTSGTGFTKDDDALSDGYDDESTDEEEIQRKSWEISSTDIPNSFLPYNKNESRPSFLQSLSVSPDKKSLFGFIMVKNIAFEKKIFVKLTTNNWKSSIIISNAQYIQSFKSSNYDQFKFSMPLSNYKTLINMELVIKYEAGPLHNQQIYWDNNNNKNYHLTIKALPDVPSRKNSAPEFEDLVNRLVNMKRDLKFQHDDDDDDDLNDVDSNSHIISITPRSKSEFSTRYNFMNEELPKRPALKASYSSSDVNSVKPRYSNSFKSKQQQQTPSSNLASATPSSTLPSFISKSQDTNFNSKSYTDLLNSMCFYKGDSPNSSISKSTSSINCKEQQQNSLHNLPVGSRISAASTFHSLSDSIHI